MLQSQYYRAQFQGTLHPAICTIKRDIGLIKYADWGNLIEWV